MWNCIFINAGQCGNQVGFSLIDNIYTNIINQPSKEYLNNTFFDPYFTKSNEGKLIARAICVDTEPKVINESIERSRASKRWLIDPSKTLFQYGGAGNNWALGYEMTTGDFLEEIMGLIKKEIDFCDFPPMLTFIHSIAGGTGSGLGTKISEECSRRFQDIIRLNIVIAPYHFGEVVVQPYNSLLCLAKISNASHGVLVFENETAQYLCKEMRGIQNPSIQDLNQAICSNLTPLFLPRNSSNSHQIPMTLYDDISLICSHPGFPFLSVKNLPQTSSASVDYTFDNWDNLSNSIQLMHISGTWTEKNIPRNLRAGKQAFCSYEGINSENLVEVSGLKREEDMALIWKSVGSIVYLFGLNAKEATKGLSFQKSEDRNKEKDIKTNTFASRTTLPSAPVIKEKVKSQRNIQAVQNSLQWHLSFIKSHSLLINSSVSINELISVQHSEILVNRYQRSISLLSNNQIILPFLQKIFNKSQELYKNQAYIHQYQKYGVTNEDFLEAFHTIGSFIHNYKNL